MADKVCLPGAPASVPMQEAVRVATIDNFQGEEATVIILSLVRNNKCEHQDSLPRSMWRPVHEAPPLCVGDDIFPVAE